MADTIVMETRSRDSAGTVKKPYNSLFLEECCSLCYTEKFHSLLLCLYFVQVAGVWLYMAHSCDSQQSTAENRGQI